MSTWSTPDPDIIRDLAIEMAVDPSFVEKDWVSMQVMSRLSAVEQDGLRLAFSGGTSLSKGFGLIQRFSEDLDFKVLGADDLTKSQRRGFREEVMAAITGSEGWTVGEPMVGNKSQFFRCQLTYAQVFERSPSLRPEIRVEVTIGTPALPAVDCPLHSFIADALQQPPEVTGMPCVSPVETAADKLSALTWRMLSRDRHDSNDDPTIIRHLHDLAALADLALASELFAPLALSRLQLDLSSRGSVADRADSTIADDLDSIMAVLATDPDYSMEYDLFVHGMSYASADEAIDFATACQALETLIRHIQAT